MFIHRDEYESLLGDRGLARTEVFKLQAKIDEYEKRVERTYVVKTKGGDVSVKAASIDLPGIAYSYRYGSSEKSDHYTFRSLGGSIVATFPADQVLAVVS